MSSRNDNPVNYDLVLFDILEPLEKVPLTGLVGQEISIRFENAIHCVETGKKIRKTFGEGLSYDAWLTSPHASPSITRPELSRIHEGVALRDYDWEMAHHNQPHVVYLTRTSDIKVGVTRATNVPVRWIDQGAVEAIVIAETPYRQLAGLIEVALKDHFPDKTHWQNMLRNVFMNTTSMISAKDRALDALPEEYHDFISDNDTVTAIEYPVLQYPVKVRSMKLDTEPVIEGKLMGIRGQYLMFENGAVINIRSHAGYRITFSW